MNPFMRKSMSTLVIQPSFRALGQMQVKWQTFEKPENKRQMYPLPYICLLFSGCSNVCHSAAFLPTALKLGGIPNFDMLSLVMRFISLVNEIQFMLISSHHNRSIKQMVLQRVYFVHMLQVGVVISQSTTHYSSLSNSFYLMMIEVCRFEWKSLQSDNVTAGTLSIIEIIDYVHAGVNEINLNTWL